MANGKMGCRITVLCSGSVVFYGMSDFFGIRLKSETHRKPHKARSRYLCRSNQEKPFAKQVKQLSRTLRICENFLLSL